MSNHSPKPIDQPPTSRPDPSAQVARQPKAQRRRHRLISLVYMLGLLLVFILSLLLLPADSGLGRLLWGEEEDLRQAP